MTFNNWINSLEILKKYEPENKYALHGEHDIIYSCVGDDKLSPDSEDGIQLLNMGWHVEEECWVLYT